MENRWRKVGAAFLIVLTIVLFRLWIGGRLSWPLHWLAIRSTLLFWGGVFVVFFLYIMANKDESGSH